MASLVNKKTKKTLATESKRMAILIPAYKEDLVIRECVDSCLKQDYPSANYEVVVISDRMSDATNESLKTLPIKLITVYFENSTKSKALNEAMAQLDDSFEIAVVLDADNIIPPNFLSTINNTFAQPNTQIVQAHRCAKNTNTPFALLDAVSEEINNSIFRKGHATMGFSAALIGSGMCFDYALFKQTMLSIDAVGGFDRALELRFLWERVKIHYLPNLDILDEKVQNRHHFSNQRRRWLSAQLHYLTKTIKKIPLAVAEGKWDFCDKVFQQMSIPRLILLGSSFIIALLISLIEPSLAIKWWALFVLLLTALVIAIPKHLFGRNLLLATLHLPISFITMIMNLFRLKGANKKFIHTQHGIKK